MVCRGGGFVSLDRGSRIQGVITTPLVRFRALGCICIYVYIYLFVCLFICVFMYLFISVYVRSIYGVRVARVHSSIVSCWPECCRHVCFGPPPPPQKKKKKNTHTHTLTFPCKKSNAGIFTFPYKMRYRDYSPPSVWGC